jgi:hypothetical protein
MQNVHTLLSRTVKTRMETTFFRINLWIKSASLIVGFYIALNLEGTSAQGIFQAHHRYAYKAQELAT